jgi:NADH:ubiquinone oxidoreductase subunit E/ferredoxin/NAD-dependent dihydropyrimidine dehydrogenase PreA subunit
MESVTLTVDGRQVTVDEGKTILQAAQQLGIDIPTLCHKKKLQPSGNCRICVVELEGQNRLVGACHTPAQAGMVVLTRSHKVLQTRKLVLELMLTAHTGPCMSDDAARFCGVHNLAADIEAGPPRFHLRNPRFYPVETQSAYVRRDMSRCILCRNCERACREIAGRNVYSMAYRGFDSKVVVGCDQPLDTEVCKDCGICIEYCPTSALMWPDGDQDRRAPAAAAKGPGPLGDLEKRTRLLTLLIEAKALSGQLTPEVLERIAGQVDLSVGDVYGVATFYHFLGALPQGEVVIRICKSLPCYMASAPLVVAQIKSILGIEPGQTTADGKFSFELTNCIGACDQAPAMLVNDRLYGGLTPEKIAGILASYRTEVAS